MHMKRIKKVSLTIRALVLGLVLAAFSPEGVPAAALDDEHRIEIDVMPSADLLT